MEGNKNLRIKPLKKSCSRKVTIIKYVVNFNIKKIPINIFTNT